MNPLNIESKAIETVVIDEQKPTTYLKSHTNISFYLKKVTLFKKDPTLDPEQIGTLINSSINHFNEKIANLKNLKNWNANLFSAHVENEKLNDYLKNNDDNIDKTRYLYNIEINKENAMHLLYDKLTLSVSFNEKIKQMYGSFILRQTHHDLEYLQYMKKQYVYYFINRFIDTYLSKYSYFELLFMMIDEKNNYYLWLKEHFLKELKDRLNENQLKDIFQDFSLEVVFRDLILMYLMQLSLVQSISSYFKTESFYKKIKKEKVIDFTETNEIAKLLAYLLHVDFPQDLYYRLYQQRFEERYMFNLGWKDFYLAPPVNYLQLGIADNKRVVDEDFCKKDPELFYFLLFLISPEYYNVGNKSIVFNSWNNVLEAYMKFVKQPLNTKDFVWKKYTKRVIESNYNYVVFLNSLNVIITSDYDVLKSNTFSAYEWVQSFVCAANLGKNVLYKQLNYLKQKYVVRRMFFFKQAIDDVHDLSLSSIQKIYNYDWSRATITRFYQEIKLDESFEELTDDLKYDDEFYKKQMQREIIIFGFFVACLIAWVDFGNMVWTVLSCSVTDLGLKLGGGSSSDITQKLTVPSIFFLVLLMTFNGFILICTVAYIVYAYKKMKKMSKKQRVNI